MKTINKETYHKKSDEHNLKVKQFALIEKYVLTKNQHPFLNKLNWSF